MDVKVQISRAALDAIAAEAKKAESRECCGLLLGTAMQIDAIIPASNISSAPHIRFEIDPSVLLGAHKAARAGGPAIAGCYHSHPSGDPTPSAEDAAQAEPNGALWLICGGASGKITAWHAVPEGQVHGRFDPVEIVTHTGP